MASIKANLKAAKAAIDEHKYDIAVEHAQNALQKESNNYHAYVFQGLAYDKLGEQVKAINAYDKATTIKPDVVLAWQGLVNLFETSDPPRVVEYQKAALDLAQLYEAGDERAKCQSVIDKFLLYAKSNGSDSQYRTALEMILPSSPIFQYLEGLIPEASLTYIKIADLLEKEETEKINKQIGERRTRLGARLGEVTSEVKREIYSASPVEDVYQHIIDWTRDDVIRYKYEEKLLHRVYDTLVVVGGSKKSDKRKKVLKLAQDMVILKRDVSLAWRIVFEWKDVDSISEYDLTTLRDFIEIFPQDGLTLVLKGYMSSDISPFPEDQKGDVTSAEKQDDSEADSIEDLETEPLMLMTDGIKDVSRSTLAHRLLCEYYIYLDEYEAATETARAALKLHNEESSLSGLKLLNALDAINLLLASALIYYQSPKNHVEAHSLFEAVLKRKPTSPVALLGTGLILKEQGKVDQAVEYLQKASSRDPNNIQISTEHAWCKALLGEYEAALSLFEQCLEQLEVKDHKTRDLKSTILYRTGMCLWNIKPDFDSRRNRKGAYLYFLDSLKANLNYAPAYSILGQFYSNYAKDAARARKCYQKAFEISASEVESAHCLAQIFADSKDWDLVEAVARRVVESGYAKPMPGSNRKGLSWPYAALGVVEIGRQDYTSSVASFQSSLRIAPESYHFWVGLGESYLNSGRFIAATRAFQQAESIESTSEEHGYDRWFAQYMIAVVKRELGEYEASISEFHSILEFKPSEFGVLVAFAQTFVESSWRNIELGFFGRATENAKEALEIAVHTIKLRASAFSVWKAFGDACALFSYVASGSKCFPKEKAFVFLQQRTPNLTDSHLSELDKVDLSTFQSLNPNQTNGNTEDADGHVLCLQAAILGFKGAINAAQDDVHAQAVGWYNLGWAEHRAHECNSQSWDANSSSGFLKASIQCFKHAIELEAGNSEFWNALGLVTTHLSPKVAQHSFIRSLFLNDKSARIWTNLGTLYLLNNDTQLANEAFTRAQSTDPDYAHAWLGQGILAQLLGDPEEARLLFTHAYEISDSTSIVCRRQYTLSTFDFLARHPDHKPEQLIDPIFALRQLLSRDSDYSQSYTHLLALLLERIGSYTESADLLSSTCAALEEAYERDESPQSLASFAKSKADLARTYLASHSYTLAIESAQTALDLCSSTEDWPPSSSDERTKCRLSAHLTSGLAHYFSSADLTTTTSHFTSALNLSNAAPDIVCLFAQVLWAKNDNDDRATAQEHLLATAAQHENHVQTTLLLGAMALLTGDTETRDAVKDDLEAQRTSKALTTQQTASVTSMLRHIARSRDEDHAGSGEKGEEERSAILEGVMLRPGDPRAWSALAAAEPAPDGQDGDSVSGEPALMARETALRGAPPRGNVSVEQLAETLEGTGIVRDRQKAMVLAPWRYKSGVSQEA